MYLITNRQINKGSNLKVFGKKPNSEGPNELRLFDVNRSGRGWRVTAVADKLTRASVNSLVKQYDLNIDPKTEWNGSLRVACELYQRARSEQKSILFFVHGYNNDVEDVMRAAFAIEELYDVIVVPFTWPANGGGSISGTLSYRSDKADARTSANALNRVVGKIQSLHRLLTESRMKKLRDRADRKHVDNPQMANAYFSKLVDRECPVTLNLLCHSMGNYLFKHTLKTSDNATSNLVFDNICLVAADANNHAHREWVGKLDVRKRVYVVINEDDFALKFSRKKPGDEQLARLGHYTLMLDSPNAHYIDITGSDHVDTEHTYFKGEAAESNGLLRMLFEGMFNGQAVENQLVYHADNNCYRFS